VLLPGPTALAQTEDIDRAQGDIIGHKTWQSLDKQNFGRMT